MNPLRETPVSMCDKAGTFFGIVLLSFLMVCPMGGQAACDTGEEGDIPFKVFFRGGVVSCVQCEGPWFRSTVAFVVSNVRVPSDGCIFYRAKNTAFSPYGKWNCYLYFDCSGRPRSNVQFILEGNSVELIVDRLGLSVNQPRNGAVKAMSSLGDNGNAFQAEGASPDIDMFQFAGTAEDGVTVRLEADRAAGNNNGRATLRVQGASLHTERTGMLPLEVSAVLKATTTYDITIEQIAGEQSYRGGYILSVASSRGLIDTLTPTNSVEN
jgi:hypothetical protein